MRPAEIDDLAYNVSGLLQETVGGTRNYEWDLSEMVLDQDLRARNLVGVVRLLRVNRGILATGEASSDVVLECSRCLIYAEKRIQAPFEEEFRPSVDVSSGAPVDVVEEGESEEDYFTITPNHMLDLGEAVRQAILVNIPFSTVCRPDCAGLCPNCGADLNIVNCDCVREPADGRLAALGALLDQLENKGDTTNGRTT